jgi:hypothetical protein
MQWTPTRTLCLLRPSRRERCRKCRRRWRHRPAMAMTSFSGEYVQLYCSFRRRPSYWCAPDIDHAWLPRRVLRSESRDELVAGTLRGLHRRRRATSEATTTRGQRRIRRKSVASARAATTVRVDGPASGDSSSIWQRLETTQEETGSPHRLLRFSRSRFRFGARETLPIRRGSASWWLRVRRRTPIAGNRAFRDRVAPMLRAGRRRAACRRCLG